MALARWLYVLAQDCLVGKLGEGCLENASKEALGRAQSFVIVMEKHNVCKPLGLPGCRNDSVVMMSSFGELHFSFRSSEVKWKQQCDPYRSHTLQIPRQNFLYEAKFLIAQHYVSLKENEVPGTSIDVFKNKYPKSNFVRYVPSKIKKTKTPDVVQEHKAVLRSICFPQILPQEGHFKKPSVFNIKERYPTVNLFTKVNLLLPPISCDSALQICIAFFPTISTPSRKRENRNTPADPDGFVCFNHAFYRSRTSFSINGKPIALSMAFSSCSPSLCYSGFHLIFFEGDQQFKLSKIITDIIPVSKKMEKEKQLYPGKPRALGSSHALAAYPSVLLQRVTSTEGTQRETGGCITWANVNYDPAIYASCSRWNGKHATSVCRKRVGEYPDSVQVPDTLMEDCAASSSLHIIKEILLHEAKCSGPVPDKMHTNSFYRWSPYGKVLCKVISDSVPNPVIGILLCHLYTLHSGKRVVYDWRGIMSARSFHLHEDQKLSQSSEIFRDYCMRVLRRKKLQPIQPEQKPDRYIVYIKAAKLDSKVKRIGPHLDIFQVFGGNNKPLMTKKVVKMIVHTQAAVRGWLERKRFERVSTKALYHGRDLRSVMEMYRRLIYRVRHQLGLWKTRQVMNLAELEEWMDRKKFYETMFAKREDWKGLQKSELLKYFNECGHFPTQKQIDDYWERFHNYKPRKHSEIIQKSQVIEMLFTLYPPLGAHVRQNVQLKSTWLRPIVDGEEGYKYIVSGHPILKRANIRVVGKLVAKSIRERKLKQ
ncbi:PREDICTED: uncharacterized protein LOC105995669 [Dipodomys ordii]|uniref:Uncharacterized protein LOC105995669 n=1 Tax=Dipodomys ordii TaxID=10020 RepID=A0A1S3G9L6_DIPOR|nr:PREDICTED: uncharacterized protein LOC105995669 [Dipodomys ordii]